MELHLPGYEICLERYEKGRARSALRSITLCELLRELLKVVPPAGNVFLEGLRGEICP